MLDRDDDEVGRTMPGPCCRVDDLCPQWLAVDGQAGGAQALGALSSGDEPGLDAGLGEVVRVHGTHGAGTDDSNGLDRSFSHSGSLATERVSSTA